MSTIKWFRLYPELLHDPKLRRFTTVQKWLWIAALCEAAQSSDRGKLVVADGVEYTDDDLAHAAGLAPEELEQAQGFIEKCIKLKMMERNADGSVTIVNFLERQYDNPSDRPEAVAERVRRSRAKKKSVTFNQQNDTVTKCNDPETNGNALYTDTDIDITPPPISPSWKPQLEEVVVGGRPLHISKSAYDLYHHYFGEKPNDTVLGLLNSYLDDGMKPDALAWAMRAAVEKAKGWDYAKGTIERMFSRRVFTAEQAEMAEQEFKAAKERQNVVPFKNRERPDRVNLYESPKQTMYDPAPWLGMS